MAKLQLTHGPGARKSYPLDNHLTVIGRQPGVTILLEMADISRLHAQIRREEDQFVLEDLGSSCGTFLNGLPLQGRATLRDGDRIGIGSCEFVCIALPSDECIALPSDEHSALLGPRTEDIL